MESRDRGAEELRGKAGGGKSSSSYFIFISI